MLFSYLLSGLPIYHFLKSSHVKTSGLSNYLFLKIVPCKNSECFFFVYLIPCSNFETDVTTQQLELKERLCRELLELLERLGAGECRMRGR